MCRLATGSRGIDACFCGGDIRTTRQQIERDCLRQNESGVAQLRPGDVVRIRAAPDQGGDGMYCQIAIGIGLRQIFFGQCEQGFGLFLRGGVVQSGADASCRQAVQRALLLHGLFSSVDQHIGTP